MPHLTLVLGGARSGKSRHGEALCEALPAPWLYLATAEAWDQEMRERISHHKARRGEGWVTVEAPLALAEAIAAQDRRAPLLVDCLTLWLTNLMLGEQDVVAATAELEAALAQRKGPSVLVANEVGLGIVPENALARAFRDEAGRLNQRMAAIADRVLFMVAGIAMTVKG